MNLRYAGAVLVILLAGCSASHTAPSYVIPGAPTSTLVHHTGAAGMQGSPQSLGSWATRAPMPTARAYLGVGVIHGILYAVGGENAGGSCLDTVEAYDPKTNSWTTKAPMLEAQCPVVGVIDDKLYAAGGSPPKIGNAVETYDPATNTWSYVASFPGRFGYAVGVVNDILYGVGGYSGRTLRDVYAYNPKTNTWSKRRRMPTARWLLAASESNGMLYAIGGLDNFGGDLNTVEAYNPTSRTWATVAPMPTARDSLASRHINSIVYAVGGETYSTNLNTVESYDPTTNVWTTDAPMPTARAGLDAGTINGILYAVGGTDGTNVFNVVEAFTP